MSNANASAKSVRNPAEPVKFDTPRGPVTSKSVICELWKRSSAAMTHDDNLWFSRATEHAGMMIGNLRQVAAGIAGLIGCDVNAGNFQEKQELATLLWFFEDALGTIEAMIDIGSEAEYRLRRDAAEATEGAK